MKLLKRALCGVLLAFVFILASCGKKEKEKYNSEISTSDLGCIIHELAFTFDDFCYFDEETFTTDPDDSDYEIGFALESGLKYEIRRRKHMDSEYMAGLDDYCLGYHKVRRNKLTKELDETFYASVNSTDEVKPYDIVSNYNYNSKIEVTMSLYSYNEANDSQVNYTETELTNNNLFDYIDFEFWTVPVKNIKHDKSMNEYYFRYNGSDWIKCTDDNFDLSGRVDFVFKDKNGKEVFYITLSTALKLN